jgi:hypothetical protein
MKQSHAAYDETIGELAAAAEPAAAAAAKGAGSHTIALEHQLGLTFSNCKVVQPLYQPPAAAAAAAVDAVSWYLASQSPSPFNVHSATALLLVSTVQHIAPCTMEAAVLGAHILVSSKRALQLLHQQCGFGVAFTQLFSGALCSMAC